MFNASMAPLLAVGVDLGSCNTRVVQAGKSQILDAPSAVAIEGGASGHRAVAFGSDAQNLVGRSPSSTRIVRPIEGGVIADYHSSEALLAHLFEQVSGRIRWRKVSALFAVPADMSEIEQRALQDAARAAGAREVHLVRGLITSALGSGLDIASPVGSMIVSIGGGRTEIAVLSLSGVVTSRSIRVASSDFDAAITHWLRRYQNLMVGPTTAEKVKLEVGGAIATHRMRQVRIRGRDLASGAPRTFDLTTAHVAEAISDVLSKITSTLLDVLRETPPELAADILERGVLLTGQGAKLPDLDLLFRQATGLPFFLADGPGQTVARGLIRCLEEDSLFESLTLR